MPQGAPSDVESKISELKVSAYTMTMEPGLYCVFNSPESSMPDAGTGLPNVRVSPAPGQEGGKVEVFGVSSEGWLGEISATLVRAGVSGAKLLVTVYQEANAKISAPQIQVLRLAGPAVAPAGSGAAANSGAGAQGGAAARQGAPERMEVMAHVYGRGDVGNHMGEWTGEPGSKRWIEGFGIAQLGTVPAGDMEYQAVLGRGWLSPWSEGGQFCGSRGMSLPILGLKVRLRGRSAETHRLVMTATFVDGSRVGPVGSGDPCEASSLAALESFRVEALPTGAPRAAEPERTAKAARGRVAEPAAAPAPRVKAGRGRAAAAKVEAEPVPPPASKPAGNKRRGRAAVPAAAAPAAPAAAAERGKAGRAAAKPAAKRR